MKERPILFSGEMVRAILAGKKTMTRRPVKPRFGNPESWDPLRPGAWRYWHPDLNDEIEIACPYGEPGDRLWCREAHVRGTMNGGESNWVRYRATDEGDVPSGTRWKPAIHMPRWASRLTLEVTGVRVERLHEISEDDARAEGFADGAAFVEAWRAMYPDGPLAPWLWVVSFRRLP